MRPLFKPLLSFFVVPALFTLVASAQETAPEKPKIEDAKPAENDSGAEKPVAPPPQSTPAPKASPTPKPKAAKTSRARATPAKATPAPTAPTPTPKPKSFIGRMFHGHPDATPAPIPATPAIKATPNPKSRRHKPKPKDTAETTEDAVTDGKKPDAVKPPEKTPEKGPEKAPEKQPIAEEAGPVKKGRKGSKPAPVETPKPVVSQGPVDPETAERNRYTQAKAKAEQDAQIQDLKTKADSAVSDEEGKKALRAYYKALFTKMRKIDSGLRERIDVYETTILKKLDDQ